MLPTLMLQSLGACRRPLTHSGLDWNLGNSHPMGDIDELVAVFASARSPFVARVPVSDNRPRPFAFTVDSCHEQVRASILWRRKQPSVVPKSGDHALAHLERPLKVRCTLIGAGFRKIFSSPISGMRVVLGAEQEKAKVMFFKMLTGTILPRRCRIHRWRAPLPMIRSSR
jgi:hypothetical protein